MTFRKPPLSITSARSKSSSTNSALRNSTFALQAAVAVCRSPWTVTTPTGRWWNSAGRPTLIGKVLDKRKSAIVLVPEISLTPQMVNRFIARFGEEKIALLHSKLSVGERYDEWKKIERGDAKIVIGARSAVFAPVKDLGIIIIDEEHDTSYKSDMTP
ncbi:MAG: DEAD/DEAH box helicase, partial [Fibrobacter sp.]|nr:DEAD/DEAH box helicase [Fibrobacter sp.]